MKGDKGDWPGRGVDVVETSEDSRFLISVASLWSHQQRGDGGGGWGVTETWRRKGIQNSH